MNKNNIVLLVLVTLVILVEANSNSRLVCRYTRKCVVTGQICVRHISRTFCRRRVLKRYRTVVRRRICLQVARGGTRKCFKCKRFGTRRVSVWRKKATCGSYYRKRVCTKHQRYCKRKSLVKRCHTVRVIDPVTGPEKCPEGQVLKFEKRCNQVRRFCVPAATRKYTLRTCSSYLDPHTNGINGKHFEFQVEGDFVMAETSDGSFSVHQRLKRFGHYTGTVGFAVLVNGADVIEYSGNGSFLLNNRSISFKDGEQTQFPNGGHIIAKNTGTNREIQVYAANGAKIAYQEYNGIQGNIQVHLPSDLGVKGYCTGTNTAFWMKNTASGLFAQRMRVKYLNRALPKPKKPSRRAKKNEGVRCKAAGLKGILLKNCVHDTLLLRNKRGQRKAIIAVLKRIKSAVRKGKIMRIRKSKGVKKIRARRYKKAVLKRAAKRAVKRRRRRAAVRRGRRIVRQWRPVIAHAKRRYRSPLYMRKKNYHRVLFMGGMSKAIGKVVGQFPGLQSGFLRSIDKLGAQLRSGNRPSSPMSEADRAKMYKIISDLSLSKRENSFFKQEYQRAFSRAMRR